MNLIIYGCGVTGQAIYQECVNKNLEITCFCDDSLTVRKYSSFGVPVLTLDEIIAQYYEPEFLIGIHDANGIISKLTKAGFTKWRLSHEILDNGNYKSYDYTKTQSIAIYEIETCIMSHRCYGDEEKLFLRNVDLVITEKCSLKCRDCSNLSQYYKHPENFSCLSVIDSLNMLLKYVDEIYELRILGGEPLMNGELYEMLKVILPNPKIYCIPILTNGTIIPPDKAFDVLRNKKINFIVTEYPGLSVNIKGLEKKLIENGINYYIQEASGWMSCADIRKHGRDKQELILVYDDCCAKNLTTMLKGVIYKCPFMANAFNLRAVERNENDYIDVFSLSNTDFEDARSKLYNFLHEKTMFYTCDYCNGRSFGASEIDAAIQTKKPLPYDIVD